MSSIVRSLSSPCAALVRRLLGTAAALLLLVGAASPSTASPETLKRSLSNILLAPLDLALSPIVAAHSIYTGMLNVDDSTGVRVAYVLPGWIFNTAVQCGGAVMRETTGLIELLPGLGLFFFEADLDPLFAPVERGEALLDIETDAIAIRAGIDYTSQPI